jgi:hypothetical protein
VCGTPSGAAAGAIHEFDGYSLGHGAVAWGKGVVKERKKVK